MIEQIKELNGRISTLEESMKNIVRVGTVVNQDEKLHRCRVEFKDNDGMVSFWCQVIAMRTHGDKEYWLPALGEMVICAFLPFGHEQGFIIGSAYNSKDKPPEGADKDRRVIQQKGKNKFVMDRKCADKEKIKFETEELHIFADYLVVHGTIVYEQLVQGTMPWECD